MLGKHAELMELDRLRQVGVQIERQSPLLIIQAGRAELRAETVAGKVAAHFDTLLIGKDDPGVACRRRIFLEPRAQIRRAPPELKIVKDAHFRLVVGAAADLFRAVGGQPAIIGPAEAQAVEAGADPRPGLLDLGKRRTPWADPAGASGAASARSGWHGNAAACASPA